MPHRLTPKNIHTLTPYNKFSILEFSGFRAYMQATPKLLDFSGIYPTLNVKWSCQELAIVIRFDFEKRSIHFIFQKGNPTIKQLIHIVTSQTNSLTNSIFQRIYYSPENIAHDQTEKLIELGFTPGGDDDQTLFFDLLPNSQSHIALKRKREDFFQKKPTLFIKGEVNL